MRPQKLARETGCKLEYGEFLVYIPRLLRRAFAQVDMPPESSPPPAGVWLLVGQVDETGQLRQIPLQDSPFRIGRRPDLHFTIPCRSVSNQHAEITIRGDAIDVVDLGSTNGTYVNGVRINSRQRLTEGDLVQFANAAFRVARTVDAESQNLQTVTADTCSQALVLVRFDKLMSDRAVIAHFQPIVELEGSQSIGYEVLGRSQVADLETPYALFNAAAQLGVEGELSRLFRAAGMIAAQELPAPGHVFLNTHPVELNNVEQLVDSLWELRRLAPQRPVTLEIHESTVTSAASMAELRARLDDLNIGLAYDDFGAGQARLVELAEVRPNFLKFDMGLTQGISEASAPRQQMLENLVRMTRELEVQPLAEGVENAADAETCRQMGFLFAQGYYFGRPGPAAFWAATADVCAS